MRLPFAVSIPSGFDAAGAAMRLHLTNSRERLRQAHEEAQAQG